MTTSFSSILDAPSNTIDRTTKQLPAGHYVASVKSIPEAGKSAKKQTEFREFTMAILEAMDDVDEDALDEYLTKIDGSKKSLQDCSIKNTYYITEGSIGRLLQFLDHLDGVKPDEADDVAESANQRLAECVGKQCIIFVKHEPWQSGEGVTARVQGTAPVE